MKVSQLEKCLTMAGVTFSSLLSPSGDIVPRLPEPSQVSPLPSPSLPIEISLDFDIDSLYLFHIQNALR